MKVMLIANSSWNIVNFRSDLISELKSKGFKVQVLAPKDSYSNEISKMGCEYKELALSNRGVNILAEIKVFLKIFFYVRLLNPDIILSFTIKPNIYTGFISRFLRKSVICSVTGLGSTFTDRMSFNFFIAILYKYAFKKIKACFFQNYDDMQYFLENKFVEKGQALFVPGSGVNIEVFKKKKTKCRKKKKFVFTFVGRILKEKGIEELAKAGRRLSSDFKIKIVIAGLYDKSQADKNLCKIFDEAVKDGIFQYDGFVQNITNVLNETDCMVLPSYREGSSRAILEAMSMRVPIIASNVPGCNNLVEDGVTGFLTKSMDFISLEENMKKMLGLSQKERKNMGNNGRKKVVAEFHVKRVVNIYVDTIKKFL